MSRLSFAPLLFGLSTVLVVGLLIGGLWYAGKYNDDQAQTSVAAQSSGHSSQVLPGDEKQPASTPKDTSDTHPPTTQPAPPKPSAPAPTPTPAPKSTPKPAPAPTPRAVATTGPTHIPSTGANAAELGVSGLMIALVTFLAMQLRTQRAQLRALR